jgi:hypothetical protein
VRQYSYFAATAGVVILVKASASGPAAGAAASFKSCFIFSLDLSQPLRGDIGCRENAAPSTENKSQSDFILGSSRGGNPPRKSQW